jgi:hypothetical protein
MDVVLTTSDLIQAGSRWANDNQGVVAIVLAVLSAIGTAIFALRRKPKFGLRLIPGPTYCCTFLVGQKYGEYDVHRTGIALYLDVTNVGSRASSITSIRVAYHWNLVHVVGCG